MAITNSPGDFHIVSGLTRTATSDTGGTGDWIPVAKDNVGLDLSVTTGTARVEMTACSLMNLANAVVTTVSADTLTGTLTGPATGSTLVNGASAVRLVATGVAQLSVRT